jgi:hypothetical protein
MGLSYMIFRDSPMPVFRNDYAVVVLLTTAAMCLD